MHLGENRASSVPKQEVNGEAGVDYKVLKRGSYDGTTLVRMQQTYEGKVIWSSINCT